ncbi:MAG: ATP-binding protein [Elusimicrobia bacterium]|nr:ATP-binding protein [Elusimicrobiota bacterium]
MSFVREDLFDALWKSLRGEAFFIQAVAGPRQVGKTTLVLEIINRWKGPTQYETADQPAPPDVHWIVAQWEKARRLVKKRDGLLVLDEVQKIPRWSEAVKKLWDEDRRGNTRLRVVLLGSSALLVQRGLAESLTGRFELHRHPHWSFAECQGCFGIGLEEYLVFGGYPGGMILRQDPVRWGRYIRDAVIETVLGKDVLLLSPVQKPALLRQTFGMACTHPAEVLSYQKMVGQLSDAGNTVTIAHYLDLLSKAFLFSPLPRWSGSRLRQRGSTPKIIVRDNGLINALAFPTLDRSGIDATWRGRLVENAVGAALAVLADQWGGELYYWRDRSEEVDFVFSLGKKVIGVEVKSGTHRADLSGLTSFQKQYPHSNLVLIGGAPPPFPVRHLSLQDFFNHPNSILS